MPFSKDRLTVLVPAGIGLAANFKKASSTVDGVSLVRLTKKGSLADGSLLLELTMKHISEINSVAKDLSHEDRNALLQLLRNMRSRYHGLLSALRQLETRSKETSLFEFSKKRQLRLETQKVCVRGYRLYAIAKSTSDDLQHAVIDYNVGTIERIEGDLSANERVAGISLRLDGLDAQQPQVASLLMEMTKRLAADDTIQLNNTDGLTLPNLATETARMGASSTFQNIACTSSPTVPAISSNCGAPLLPLAANLVAGNDLNPSFQPGGPHSATSTAGDPIPPLAAYEAADNVPNPGPRQNAQNNKPSSPSAVPGTPCNNVPPINTLADLATILPSIPGLISPSRPSSPPPTVNLCSTHTHTHNYHYYLLLNQNSHGLSQVIGSMESAPVTNFPPPNPAP